MSGAQHGDYDYFTATEVVDDNGQPVDRVKAALLRVNVGSDQKEVWIPKSLMQVKRGDDGLPERDSDGYMKIRVESWFANKEIYE